MGGHAYRHRPVIYRVSVKYSEDALLLRDQCQTLENALPNFNENSAWYHILSEHIRRLKQEQIPALEQLSWDLNFPGLELERRAYAANAQGKSLLIDLKEGSLSFV